jgi:hypothetical protein
MLGGGVEAGAWQQHVCMWTTQHRCRTLLLEQREPARRHALAGYKWAWADGPPWCWHWDLQRCRTVLQAIGEPEPLLPPLDPAKVKPLEHEPDIRRLLAEHAQRQR